jgi:hypothetical protein
LSLGRERMVKWWPRVVVGSLGLYHHVASFRLQAVDVIQREVQHDHQQVGEEVKEVGKAVDVLLPVAVDQRLAGRGAIKGQEYNREKCQKLKEFVGAREPQRGYPASRKNRSDLHELRAWSKYRPSNI